MKIFVQSHGLKVGECPPAPDLMCSYIATSGEEGGLDPEVSSFNQKPEGKSKTKPTVEGVEGAEKGTFCFNSCYFFQADLSSDQLGRSREGSRFHSKGNWKRSRRCFQDSV